MVTAGSAAADKRLCSASTYPIARSEPRQWPGVTVAFVLDTAGTELAAIVAGSTPTTWMAVAEAMAAAVEHRCICGWCLFQVLRAFGVWGKA